MSIKKLNTLFNFIHITVSLADHSGVQHTQHKIAQRESNVRLHFTKKCHPENSIWGV